MNKSRWNLLGAGCGIIDVLLSLIALLIVPFPPAVGASAKVITSYYTANSTALLISNYLLLLTIVFFLWFFGYVSVILRNAEGESPVLSTVILGAAIAAASIFLLAPLIALALLSRTAPGAESVAVGALSDLSQLSITVSGFPALLLVGLTSVVALRTTLLPRWFGGPGLLLVILLLLGSLSLFIKSGPLAAGGLLDTLLFLGFLLWELSLSIVLVVRVLATKKAEAVPGVA